MSDDKIKNVVDAIKDTEMKQRNVVERVDDGSILEKDFPAFSFWLEYESILTNLKTQKYILESIKDTDRITTLAYRVALISLGASMISIISIFIK